MKRAWSVPRVLLLVLLTVALSIPAHSAPSGGSSLTVAQGADISTGDPRQGVFGTDYSAYFAMCDPLVNYDDNWKIVPALAASWKVVSATVYEFKLRPARFQDGTPVTAADVKATMDRILDPAFKSEVATDFVDLVQSTEVIDTVTVRFNLKVPYANFLGQMPYIFPVPTEAVRRLGDQEFARRPVCAGPYTLREWVPDDHVTMEAFPGYWGGRPQIGRIVLKPIPQGSTRAAALRSGDIDVAVNIAPDQLAGVKQDAKLRVIEQETGRMEFFLFDTFAKPFDDKRVRQAFNYAVDWDAIIKSIMGGFGKRAPGPTMTYMFGHKDVRGYPYDPAKAKTLLAEAGFPNGFEVTVETPSGRYFQDKEIAQAVVGYLQRVGLKASLRTSEWGVYRTRKRDKDFKVGLWGFVSLYHSVDDLGFHFEPGRGANYYNIPAVTALFEQARLEVDDAKRAAIYGRLTDLLVDEAVFLYGVRVVGLYGVNRRVQWEPRSGSDILFGLRSARLR